MFLDNNGTKLVERTKVGGLYYHKMHHVSQDSTTYPSNFLNTKSSSHKHSAHRANAASKPSIELLHARLGHSFPSRMKYIDPIICSHVDDFFYEICIFSKHHKSSFPRR